MARGSNTETQNNSVNAARHLPDSEFASGLGDWERDLGWQEKSPLLKQRRGREDTHSGQPQNPQNFSSNHKLVIKIDQEGRKTHLSNSKNVNNRIYL